MRDKVILVCDPGIDGAFAVALALFDENLEVLGVAATPGNVSAEQATLNVHILVEQLDPPRWPRLGEAPAVDYGVDGRNLHGPTGLGNTYFPVSKLHNLPTSEKLIVELVRQHPGEVSIICMGPLTVLARAFEMYPDIKGIVKRLVCLGGTLHEPGNAGPVSEFHFHCDPPAARSVVHSGVPLLLIPLDVMRQVLFSPRDLLGLPEDTTRVCRFLRQIVPYGIAATSNLYGIEGFHLKDVLGVVAVAVPTALKTKPMRVDVETRGELTRGMSVFDQRAWLHPASNVDLAVDVDNKAVREYIVRILKLNE
ncbi:MAG: nucleoside hydrolase [Gemmataceae bacterium]|nr:nucleoside hydrolase [Gemmataceae bacterium]